MQVGTKSLGSVFAVSIFLLLGSLTGTTQALDKDIDDTDITLAVESELLLDQGVPSHLIDVKTNAGIVTLSGSTDNLLAKERALEVAETIKGVRAVVNRIEVRPVARPDQQIQKDINQALLDDPATDSYEIDVAVNDAFVTLTGEVESWAEKQLAAEVAKSVTGVKRIENDISIKFLSNRSDDEIKDDIVRRLENDVWVFDNFIDVEVENGNVTLRGSVGSAAAKSHAEINAWLAGVSSVDDSELEVKWWTRNEMRRDDQVAIRTDEQIKEAIKDAFLYDPRVYSFSPKIEVNDGEVILSGTVGNLKAKMAAEQDAENTTGVWRVLNFLKVRPDSEITDDQIAENIREAFSKNPIVERHEITVSVHNGKAYLYGAVDSEFEKAQAEDLASRVRGVIVIDNNLTVDKAWTWKSDRAISADVRSEVFWNPDLETESIEVTVDDGIVTLRGTVDTWRQRHFATEEAHEGGARKVKNKLEIRE